MRSNEKKFVMDFNGELWDALLLELARQGMYGCQRAVITSFIEAFVSWSASGKTDVTFNRIVARAKELKRTKYGKEV